MNHVIAIRWAEALESGRYPQGYGRLRTEDGYCCLGVLCDISRLGEWDPDGCYLGERFVVPGRVGAWAQLSGTFERRADQSANPHLVMPELRKLGSVFLSDLNDDVYSDPDDDREPVTWDFKRIAALIRERWADL